MALFPVISNFQYDFVLQLVPVDDRENVQALGAAAIGEAALPDNLATVLEKPVQVVQEHAVSSIVHDVDRPAALRRARRCLDEMVIEGIRTNIPFLRRIINNPDFIKGDFDTGFVGRLLAERASAA